MTAAGKPAAEALRETAALRKKGSDAQGLKFISGVDRVHEFEIVSRARLAQ